MVNVQYPVEFDTMLGHSSDCEYRRYPGASVACALLDYNLETQCSCDACPLMAMVQRAYCCECGHVRPDGKSNHDCVPCYNAGHACNLIEDDTDRIRRIEMSYEFYELHDFRSQRDKIPGWRRKIKPPVLACISRDDGDLSEEYAFAYAHRGRF